MKQVALLIFLFAFLGLESASIPASHVKNPEKNVAKADEFDYSQIKALWRFTGKHPQVMQKRIDEKGWTFDHDISTNQFTLRQRIKKWVQKVLNKPLGEHQGYKIIEP